jgi:hypothetical protein
MKSLNVANITTVVLAAALVASCGTSNGTKNLGAAPNGFTPANSITALSSVAQTAIMGTYTGTLISTDYSGENNGSQSFQLVMAPATVSTSSSTYVSMTLTSNSPAGSDFGAINDIELMDFQSASGKVAENGETEYAFYTTGHVIPGLTNTAVQLEIDFFLTSSNQVDSSQSQILIYDCGYSTTCSTSSPYPDAQFQGLVKIH